MKIGYARVSTLSQKLESQKEQLENAGCEKLFVEKITGTSTDQRKVLKDALEFVREGDVLVVTKIDRLARSVKDLHNIVSDLADRGIDLVFLKEKIDTSTPAGKLMFTVLGAIAEFEADLIRERTTEGRERAKAQGKHMGRPGKDEKLIKRALKMFHEREQTGMSVADIVRATGVPRATIYKRAKEEAEQAQELHVYNIEESRKEGS